MPSGTAAARRGEIEVLHSGCAVRRRPSRPRISLPEGEAAIDGQLAAAFTALLSDLVRLVVLVVGGYAAALARAHHSAAQAQRAEQIGKTAVWAVEQLAAGMGWDGRTKFSRALGFARRLAARAGLRLDDDQWQAILEAAVRGLQQAGADLPKERAAPRPPLTAVGAGGRAQVSRRPMKPQSGQPTMATGTRVASRPGSRRSAPWQRGQGRPAGSPGGSNCAWGTSSRSVRPRLRVWAPSRTRAQASALPRPSRPPVVAPPTHPTPRAPRARRAAQSAAGRARPTAESGNGPTPPAGRQ